MPSLLDRIRNGEIDTTSLITHHLTLDDAPHGYDIFKNKEDECVKVVMKVS
jgi:threonine dehydrogenase-like Zn-dependent dehydrogenase